MASKTLSTSDDHNDRVRSAENSTRLVDCTRGDFTVFQAALTSLEQALQYLWSTLKLRPTFNESFGAQFTQQKQLCEATYYLLDGVSLPSPRFHISRIGLPVYIAFLSLGSNTSVFPSVRTRICSTARLIYDSPRTAKSSTYRFTLPFLCESPVAYVGCK